MNYQIITDATAELGPSFLEGCPEIRIIPMKVELGGRSCTYGPGGDLTAAEFYAAQRAGAFATTSQINPAVFYDTFEAVLREGRDVLYLGLTSGLSGTLQNALLSAKELAEDYPDRRVVCLDNNCASAGLGLLVREALLRQGQGMELDDLCRWVQENSSKVAHWFTVDTFEHLKHGGRVNAVSAAVGTMLQIKPLLTVDRAGKLQVVGKPRGRAAAIRTLVSKLEAEWTRTPSRTVGIAHGDNLEAAEQLKAAILAKFPDAEIRTTEIGPVIGSHTGPGMLALLYWGRSR